MKSSTTTRGRRVRADASHAPRHTAHSFRPREATLPADSAHLGQARQFAGLAARAFGFPQEAGFEITMAVSEVVANAVEHGSTSSEDLIRLRAVEEDGALVFYVTDVGTFTPPAALAADILSDRGRGLTLIRWLMDELDVRPGYEGTVIRFAKRLAA